jgi:hypothetical protein
VTTGGKGARTVRLGEGDRCPSCGGTAGVSEEDGGYRCLVCGLPRVVVDGIVQRRGSEKPLLEQAKALRLRRAALAVLGGVLLLLGLVTLTFTSIAALAFGALGFRSLIFVMGAAAPLLLSAVAFLGSRRTNGAIASAMAEAELVVAKELIQSRAATDATALARLLRLPPGRAEELFGRAEVERLLSTSDELVQRLRVEEESLPEMEESAARRNRVL